MEQNKIRTYILYTLGEILLVVVGILIALQVNNWNEQRKENQQSKVWKKAIIEDLNSIKKQIAGRITYNGQALAFAEQALPLLKGTFPKDPNTQWDMVLGAFQAGQIWPLQITGPTYREVQSRGALSLIGNGNTLERLADFYDVTAYDLELVAGGKPTYRDHIREITPWPIQKYIWDNECQSESEPINQSEFIYELESCELPRELLSELNSAAQLLHNNREIIESLQGRMSQLKVTVGSFGRTIFQINALLNSMGFNPE